MGPPANPAITDLPSATAFAEDERSVLLGYLDDRRAALAPKGDR